MAVTKQFTQLDPINNGTTAQDNFKLSDAIPAQHTDLTRGVNKLVHRTLAQSLCEPVAVCNSNNPQNGAYTATCQNYPDFALSYQDAQQNTQYLIGLKIRVIFTYGITYGSVSDGTYPTLNINGSGAIPMLAQGKTMATGSASAGQTLEFTVIPYGNGIAFDADSNVRESTSDYTIYTDGLKRINSVTNNDKNMVTSGAVADILFNYYVSKDRFPANELTQGQNINNLRTSGIYQAVNDSIGNSLIGRPSDSSIYSSWLIVMKTYNDTMTQILIANRAIYFRTANSTTASWSDWFKINKTNVSPTE